MNHNVADPEICIMVDVVGGNINQKGGRHIMGILLVHTNGIVS